MDQKTSILQILNLFTHEQKISHHHSDFLKFLSTLSVPVITQDQINIFIKTYDNSHDLLASLLIFHDVFTFDSENLQKVLSFNFALNKDIIKAAPFIYMNSLSFILSTNKSTFNEDFSTVLNAIFSLSYYDFSNSFFLYLFILEYFIENSSNLINEDNVRLICSHFCIQKKANIAFYNTMIKLIINVKICEKCLDQIFPTFAIILQMLSNTKEDVDITILCNTIIQNLLNVKYQVFELISTLSKRKENDHIKEIYEYLPKSISLYIKQKPIESFDTNDKEDRQAFHQEFDESFLNLQIEGNLESGYFPEIYADSEFSDSFYKSPVSNYLNLIASILHPDLKKTYLDSFMNSFEQLLTENYDIYFFIAFVYILSKIQCSYSLSQKALDLLFEKTIFDPSITVFDSAIIDQKRRFHLRNVIIRISFQFYKFGSTSFFKKSENYPFLFTEILLRSVKFDISKLFNDTFLNSFCKVYFELCHVDYEDQNFKMHSKRPILYFFLKYLLEIPSLPFKEIEHISEETEKLGMALLTENSLKSTLGQQIKRFLHSSAYLDFNPISIQIRNIIMLIGRMSNSPDAVNDYLQIFYEALQRNECLKYTPSSVNLFNSLLDFIENHPNEEKLIKIIKILSLYNRDIVDNWIFHRLSIIIPKSLNDSLNDDIISSLFSLVSASSSSSLTSFFIENGKPLHMFFSVFSFFDRTTELLQIINSLCDYSACNRIKLHKYEFDLILLDILIHYPNDFIFKECKIVNLNESYFDLLFEIFAKIAVTRSNQIVADRMLKVICHSQVAERFLKFFIPLEKVFEKYAVSKYPLGIQQLYFEADNITDDTVKQGFSIDFWIFVDNPISEKLKIKATVLKGMNFFQLDILQNSLYLTDINNKLLLTVPLRAQHWNAVIMNFRDDFLTIIVNKNFISEKIKLASSNSKNTFTFGNEIDNQSDFDELLSIYNLGKFSIYTKELTSSEIDLFISNNLELQPLFSFPVNPNNPPHQSATMYIDMNGFYPKLETILDTFRHIYPIENIIPLFAQFQNFKHRIQILNSIENIFQNRFNALAEIISYLLYQNDQSIFTYDLYIAFYAFMKKPNDKETFFDSLILNCDLWVHASVDDLARIANHWKEVLFPEYVSLFYRKNFFLRFLCEIRATYYILANERKIDINEINRFIHPCLDLIELVARHGFTDYKSVKYVETLLKSENHALTSQLICILPKLLAHISAEHSITRLYELLLCIDFEQYKSVFHALIQSISMIARDKFYDVMILLGYQIPNSFNYKYFENDLEQFPALSFICLKTALRSTPENQNTLGTLLLKIIVNEENTKMFLNYEMWFIWPILFALQTNEMEIISFFINSILAADFTREQLGNIFSFLDLLGIQTSLNVKDLKCIIIKGLYELLNADIKLQNQNDLLELGFECLFTNCQKKPITNELIRLYRESDFNQDDFRENSPYSGQIYSLKDLKTVLEADFLDYCYYFHYVRYKHYSKMVNSFYQIYLTIVQNSSENPTYLHRLICLCSQYPKAEPSQSKKFYSYTSHLLAFVANVYKRTKNFASTMIDFFKRSESLLQDVENLSQSTVDPLIKVYRGKEGRLNMNKKEWKRILKIHVHPHAIFDADCFEWERDFFMTPSFVSNKLKRRIKKLENMNVYRFPFLQKLVNNAQSDFFQSLQLTKTKSTSKRKESAQKISGSNSLIATYSCIRIKINKHSPCIFNLYSNQMDIITHEKLRSIKLFEIHDILTRSRLQKKTALEFFLMSGKSYLLDFAPTLSSIIIKQINGLNLPSKRIIETEDYSSFIDRSNIIQKWQLRSITTFDFLTQLNISSGRSFHDSENYIIFPWVIATAASKNLRNFDRPMAAQVDSRFDYYKKKLELNEEMPGMNNFLFGSAPSNAMLLSYYFVRIEPFTSLHLRVHDGKFDVMNRIFRSVDNFFTGMASSDDSRESAPEFYSMPEMFFDLSKIQVNNNQPEACANESDKNNKSEGNEEETQTNNDGDLVSLKDEMNARNEENEKKNVEEQEAQNENSAPQREETEAQGEKEALEGSPLNDEQEAKNDEAAPQNSEQTTLNAGSVLPNEEHETHNEELAQTNEEQKAQNEEQTISNEGGILQSEEQAIQNEEQAAQKEEQTIQKEEQTISNEEQAVQNEEQTAQSEVQTVQNEDSILPNEEETQNGEPAKLEPAQETEESPLPRGETTTQNEEPAPQNEEQAAQNEEQATHNEEPAPQNEEQVVQNEEPAPQSEEQVVQNEEPAPQSEEQVVQNEEPAPQNEEQVVQNEEPAPQSEEQAIQNVEQAAQSEEQTAQSEEQAALNEGSTLPNEGQTVQNEEPAPQNEEQVTHNEEQVTHNEEQAALNDGSTLPNEEEAQNVEPAKVERAHEAQEGAAAQSEEPPRDASASQDLHDDQASPPHQLDDPPSQAEESSSSRNEASLANADAFCSESDSSSTDCHASLVPLSSSAEFIGDLEVPPWSSNIYDFVYELRKILESDEVSDQINEWIDLLFGLSQRGEEAVKRCNLYMPYLYDDVWKDKSPDEEQMITTLLSSLGSMPPVMFKEKVGPRIAVQNSIATDKSFSFNYDHQIKLGFPFMISFSKCYIIIIDYSGNVGQVMISINKNTSTLCNKNFLNECDHIITLYHKSVVYMIDCKNSKVSSISPDATITKKVPNLENVEFVDQGVYERNFFTTSKTGSVCLWDSDKLDYPQPVLNVFSDSLRAATVSQNFGVFVFATNDGYCEIYSLNGKRFVNSIYLDGFVGQKIVITPSLGLIIVKTFEKFWILTINGFVIKKVPFLHQLCIWTTWSSTDGIDYVSVADADGNVWYFEAYYPEKAIIVKSCHDSVVGMEYDSDSHCLLIVTMKPILHIVSI